MRQNPMDKVGKTGTILVKGGRDSGNINVEVRVIQVKTVYGRDLFLCQPIAGTGTVWREKVTFKK